MSKKKLTLVILTGFLAICFGFVAYRALLSETHSEPSAAEAKARINGPEAAIVQDAHLIEKESYRPMEPSVAPVAKK